EGHDTIEGSRHNDTIQVGDNLENIQNVETIDGGKGYDTLQAGSGDDTLDFSKGPELKNIEEIDGGRGNDTIIGSQGDDKLDGNHGDDKLIGGEGNDSLIGARGNDTLVGGAGDDTIDGGHGSDTLVLQGDWQDYTVTQNDDSSFTITDSVAGRDGTDTFQGIESLQFTDQTLSVDKITQAESSDSAQAPQESAEDMLFLLDMESPEIAEGGWVEDIDAEQLEAGFASADGWEDGETGNSDEMDTAANALDLAPDTTGVINFTEGTDADGLAGLQEAGLL
ncbi:MAG: hypothetical protein NXI15_14130, partial [Gammaproteobacteria bacterium]|nr:hypothetical protein [Gammaproteobacteria bacterium]